MYLHGPFGVYRGLGALLCRAPRTSIIVAGVYMEVLAEPPCVKGDLQSTKT